MKVFEYVSWEFKDCLTASAFQANPPEDVISYTAAIASCEPVGRWQKMLDRDQLLGRTA
jgi:hypothetical protein